MKLHSVANIAAKEIEKLVGISITEQERDKVAAIVGRAMEDAVNEASSCHSTICTNNLMHDQDLAHKIRHQMEQEKISIIANLSSLR